MNNFWLKKTSWFLSIFIFVLLFNLNKSSLYESETDILLLPKNETGALSLDATVDNFKQVLESLAFNDRIAENNDALETGLELPNYKRKEFWNSKLAVTRVGRSGVIAIRNFDKSSILAKELNADTVENLIAVAGSYYKIETDLELRIIDGPIVKKITSRNLAVTIGESLLWTIATYLILFFLLPFIFFKKETGKRGLPGRDFSREIFLPKKPIPSVSPEEENYFATKDFFKQADKIEEVEEIEEVKEKKIVLPRKSAFSFSDFGKKAPTPANLPISEEDVPDIFRQKIATPEVKNADEKSSEKTDATQTEYVPREATAEEVKARLNKLLSGGR